MDKCKYVNVFQGSAEYEIPVRKGISAKWFFLKAGTGNTVPCATLPFGKMSASPYSGGYPTGYGNYKINTHSKPEKFDDGKGLYGFAHLQQSGTGTIGYYYNYFLVTPTFDSVKRTVPTDEKAEPGYYSCKLDGILCELTVNGQIAFHKYTFPEKDGKVIITPDNCGLKLPGENEEKCEILSFEIKNGMIFTKLKCEGIILYISAYTNGKITKDEKKAVITGFGTECYLQVNISLNGFFNSFLYGDGSRIFEDTRNSAYNKWNEKLSSIEIEPVNEETNEIFYSNLYHSFVKPCDWSGESFIYDKDKPFMLDFATLWDMYKTQLPLVLMTDKQAGKDITETLMSVCEKTGYIPNSIGLTDKFKEHSTQARMLGDYVLMTSYRYGVDIDVNRMLKVIESDIFAEDKTDFIKTGKCMSNTFVLDMADGCGLCAEIAKENGNTELCKKLYEHSQKWISCFDESTGLLKNDSEYYEGTLYNYSFRQMLDMKKRIEIAGGKENFVKLLDEFFGYGKEDTVLNEDPKQYVNIANGFKLGRFEGFNNESDTEAPYSYIYAGRQDRTCEIIRSGMKYMFSKGRGGLPGNNDSGALSSYYVFAVLGLFPVAGQNLFLIGSPAVHSAKIKLFNGNTLNIKVNGNSEDNIYVSSLTFNNEPVKDFGIEADKLLKGGTLEFFMTERCY